MIRKAEHKATLPARLEPRVVEIRQALAAKPVEPPARKELVRDQSDEEIMRYLLDTHAAVKISQDLVLSKAGFDGACDAIRAFIDKNGPASVSELREALGTTRRIMVPLLEKLDHDGFTLRSGDKRKLGQR